MVSFPFLLYSLTERQSLGLTLPLISHSAKGGCKALRFCCSSRTSAGWVRPHEPTDLVELQKKVQFANHRLVLLNWHSHTHSALLPLSLAHTRSHPQLGNANSCQKARMICPYSLSCPMEKLMQWSEKGCVHTAKNTVWFYGFRHSSRQHFKTYNCIQYRN